METEQKTRSEAERAKLHQEADRRWRKLEREHPELADTVAFGRGLVARYIDELPAAGRVALMPEAAREKLAAGIPLLEDQDLDLDLPGVRAFFSSLCLWLGEQGELAEDARRIRRAIWTGELDVDALVAAALAGEQDPIARLAGRLGVSLTLLQTLTGFTVSAALMETARALTPLVEQEGVEWRHGLCPICGGPPLLAELQGSEGRRVLRCAACGAGWGVPRLRCPHCGSEDQQQQHYLALDSEAEKYRVELCENCQGFIKSATSFVPTPAELLTIEDAAMLHLDAAARERGYSAMPDGDEGGGQKAEEGGAPEAGAGG
jgi:FdhE protein